MCFGDSSVIFAVQHKPRNDFLTKDGCSVSYLALYAHHTYSWTTLIHIRQLYSPHVHYKRHTTGIHYIILFSFELKQKLPSPSEKYNFFNLFTINLYSFVCLFFLINYLQCFFTFCCTVLQFYTVFRSSRQQHLLSVNICYHDSSWRRYIFLSLSCKRIVLIMADSPVCTVWASPTFATIVKLVFYHLRFHSVK